MIIIVLILACIVVVIFILAYDGRKRSNPSNVDGYTGKIVEILSGNTCKVCISTIDGVVTVIAMNDIHAIEGDYVKVKANKNDYFGLYGFYVSEKVNSQNK